MPWARRDLIVKLAKLSHLLCRDPLLGDDHKVAVTLEIATPEREPAHQVGADEVLPENRVDASHQFCQQLVQLRKYRRRRRRFLFSRHRSIQTAATRRLRLDWARDSGLAIALAAIEKADTMDVATIEL